MSEAKVDGRTLRWQKMTPEEKAAQIAKMQGGRQKKPETQTPQ